MRYYSSYVYGCQDIMEKISYRTKRTHIASALGSVVSLTLAICGLGVALNQHEEVQRYKAVATARDQLLATQMCYPTTRIAEVQDHFMNPLIGNRLKPVENVYYGEDIDAIERNLGVTNRGITSKFHHIITPSILGY
jgi:hypothetical protein